MRAAPESSKIWPLSGWKSNALSTYVTKSETTKVAPPMIFPHVKVARKGPGVSGEQSSNIEVSDSLEDILAGHICPYKRTPI